MDFYIILPACLQLATLAPNLTVVFATKPRKEWAHGEVTPCVLRHSVVWPSSAST